MAKNAVRLFRDLPEDAKERARLKAETIILSNRLARLRREMGLTQTELADRLDIKQAAISRLERRADIKVSNLIRYIEGLGGTNIRLLADIEGKRRRISLAR